VEQSNVMMLAAIGGLLVCMGGVLVAGGVAWYMLRQSKGASPAARPQGAAGASASIPASATHAPSPAPPSPANSAPEYAAPASPPPAPVDASPAPTPLPPPPPFTGQSVRPAAIGAPPRPARFGDEDDDESERPTEVFVRGAKGLPFGGDEDDDGPPPAPRSTPGRVVADDQE
jgi:hypothetical protein